MSRRETLSTKVAADLARQVESGSLQPGEKIPTEAELCVIFDVSRTVIREAVAQLRSDGMLIPRQGIGVFVSEAPRAPRFEVVYHLNSLSLHHRLRVKIPLEEAAPEVDSILELWVAADWYERECHEMYGIGFAGHPNLIPLLLYDGFEGYPLRKDYEKGLSQPLVPRRPVRERYDYGERFRPVKNPATHASSQEN